ncbi:LAMI_0H01860g1_1 [Lachancea mirantina]|uniref:Autophagy-related protein 17 n=1 Tax=Lachancea mirantina TaxID=1230905 RepID=A0A1G4KE04_9SACH|nr:LAMI_0H01860g1_1 [Lachancea mirantina]
MNTSEIEALRQNARNFLTDAQELCQQSDTKLMNLKLKIQNEQKHRTKLQFIITGIKCQVEFLLNNILVKEIGENLIEHEWCENVLGDLVQEMEFWHNAIYKKIEHLGKVPNVLAGGKSFLGDYVAQESNGMLRDKLSEIPVIKAQVENIRKQYDLMVHKVRNQLLDTKVRGTIGDFNVCYSAESKNSATLDHAFPDEKERMEKELVSFLNSFTDHFDKCNLLCEDLPAVDSIALFEIVKRDDSELASIYELLEETASEVSSLYDEIMSILQEREEGRHRLMTSTSKLFQESRKHEEYLSVFKGISDLVQRFKDTCMEELQQVIELNTFYDKFEKSYANLLNEVNRRKQVSHKLSKILKSCEDALQEVNAKDINARQTFLSENGQYLPETIWQDKIDDMKPLYSMHYEVRDYDKYLQE